MSSLLENAFMFMTKKRLALIIVATVLISFFLFILGFTKLLGFDSAHTAELGRLFSVMRLIETRYVDSVDETKLINGAISGMVQSLDDPHSIYMDEKVFQQLKEHTEGEFGGIGVTMGFKGGGVHVISVLEGTPGEAAGLQAGDEILAVDGTPVSEFQPEEVALHIRGEIGTDVTLKIHRKGTEDKDITIARARIHLETAKGKMIEGTQMGYIRISSFSDNTAKEFGEALDDLKAQGMQGLIIDLRQNAGGLITSCVDIAGRVVPRGPIVSVVERDGSKKEYDSALETPFGPIVVLIDGGSASASEILAGALQDTGAATLVGTKSYGKGSVQMVIPLLHDDGLKLTIAKYLTPCGRSIDGTGIDPDVEVDLPEDTTNDVQLEKAKEILQEKIEQQ